MHGNHPFTWWAVSSHRQWRVYVNHSLSTRMSFSSTKQWQARQRFPNLYLSINFIFMKYVTNQPPKANSAVHPSGVDKWVPASAGKAKAGMVHSVSGWTRGVHVTLWDPLRTRAIPERLRGVFTTRRYTNTRLLLPLPYSNIEERRCRIANERCERCPCFMQLQLPAREGKCRYFSTLVTAMPSGCAIPRWQSTK